MRFEWIIDIMNDWPGTTFCFAAFCNEVFGKPALLTDITHQVLAHGEAKHVLEPFFIDPQGWHWDNPRSILLLTALRRRTVAVLTFFAVRRLDEVRNLRMEDGSLLWSGESHSP